MLVLPCNRITGLPRHSLTVRSLLKTLTVPEVNRHLDQEMKCMNMEDSFLLNRLCSIQFFRRKQLLSRTSSLCVLVIKSSQVCEPVKAGFL